MDYETTLTRFREGLKAGLFSLRDIEAQTGIPYTTLVEMKRSDWQQKTFTRLADLKDALEGFDQPEDA